MTIEHNEFIRYSPKFDDLHEVHDIIDRYYVNLLLKKRHNIYSANYFVSLIFGPEAEEFWSLITHNKLVNEVDV